MRFNVRLLNNFNDESGITDYGSAANEEHYSTLLQNVTDLQGSDIDYASLQLGDFSSDDALKELLNDDSASGELGKSAALERMADKSVEARAGSLSKNMSEIEQTKHENFELNTPDKLDFDTPDMPIISESDYDLQAATAYIFEELLEAGVPESDLNHAMAAGGIDDNRATIAEFHDLAQDNNIHLTDYIQDVDQAYVTMQITDGIQNIVPALGTIDAPQLAMNDDSYEQPIPVSSNAMSI